MKGAKASVLPPDPPQ